MSIDTTIQWTDSAVNPCMGCSGCELWLTGVDGLRVRRCYAGQLHQLRRANKGFSPDFNIVKLFPGRMTKAAAWADLTGKARPEKPWLDGLPRLIFISDMGDALSEGQVMDETGRLLPEPGVPFSFLKAEIIDTVRSSHGARHHWHWLTKRPARMAEFSRWLAREHHLSWPTNLWAGTSVTSKATLARAGALLGVPAAVRFLSVEPQVEAVSLASYLAGIHWVISGGESDQGDPAREFKLEWARALRDECRAAGRPFFLKQVGSRPTLATVPFGVHDGHGGDWTEWPEDVRIRELPFGR